jgi:uncharacterized protein (UPF0332 family)
VTPEEREALVRYRLEKAAHTLRQAEALGEIGEWDGAVNRAYYTMFYAALAMLVRHGFEARRHAGVLALVDRELVGRGLLAREQAASLREAFRMRQRADYAEVEPVQPDRGRELIEAARAFLHEARNRLGEAGSAP